MNIKTQINMQLANIKNVNNHNLSYRSTTVTCNSQQKWKKPGGKNDDVSYKSRNH
jgi:hypothetical protein